MNIRTAPSIRMPIALATALLFFQFVPLGAAENAKAEGVSIQKAIEIAYKNGEQKIVIPPDTYHIQCPPGSETHLTFSRMKNFEIDATGSTFIFENRDKRGILFDKCSNVIFKGATLTRETPTFSQGDIETIAPDGSYVDVGVHPGYPTDMDSPQFKKPRALTIFEKVSGKLKRGVRDIPCQQIEPLGGRLFRFHLAVPVDKRTSLAVGDMAAWRRSVTWQGEVTLLGCAGMSLLGVKITNSIGVAVWESAGDGGNRYNYTVTYAKPPKGAAQNPLLSSAADSFFSTQTRKGPILENCLWEGTDDDGVNINGSISEIMEIDGDSVVVDARLLLPQRQDVIQFFDGSCAFRSEAKVLGAENLSGYKPPEGKPRLYTKYSNGAFFRLKLDHAIPADSRWLVNANACGSGFIIRNCVTRDHRGIGFRIRSGDGIIENCLIENILEGGIVVTPEFAPFPEGPYSRNLVIRNNVIRRASLSYDWNFGALSVSSRQPVFGTGAWQFTALPGGHRNIAIEDNRFEDNDGPNIVVSSAIGVKIKDNVFVNPMHGDFPGLYPAMPTEALVYLNECSDVSFSGNRIINPGDSMWMPVALSKTASAAGVKDGFSIKVSKDSPDSLHGKPSVIMDDADCDYSGPDYSGTFAADWKVFLKVNPPDSFNGIPRTLQSQGGEPRIVRPLTIEIKSGAANIDLAALSGKFAEKDCAMVYNQFFCEKAGWMRCGVSADWWMDVFVNGKNVYSTMQSGNGNPAFLLTDHFLEFPVNAGENIFSAKILSGSQGWRFICCPLGGSPWLHEKRALNAHKKTLSCSSRKGAVAKLSIEGKSVKWISKTGPSCGMAAVSIDGAEPELIDTYSAIDVFRTCVYKKDLTPGKHILRVEVLGERGRHTGDGANGERVYIDCFLIEQ